MYLKNLQNFLKGRTISILKAKETQIVFGIKDSKINITTLVV